MTSEKEKIVLKWYHPRCLGFTGEYYAGIIAGFGLGIVFMASVPNQYLIDPGWIVAGLVLMCIGSFMARRIQDRKVNDRDKMISSEENSRNNSPRGRGG